jgi:lysyl-tRNA synthetase class II
MGRQFRNESMDLTHNPGTFYHSHAQAGMY